MFFVDKIFSFGNYAAFKLYEAVKKGVAEQNRSLTRRKSRKIAINKPPNSKVRLNYKYSLIFDA